MDKKIRTPFAAIALIAFVALNIFELTEICYDTFEYQKMLSFSAIATICINLALCGILFTKKRDNILVIGLGAATLISLVAFIERPYLINLLPVAAYALLCVFAFAWCDQSLIKADLSKIKALADKFFFIPAILILVYDKQRFINFFSDPSFRYLDLIFALSHVLIFLTLAMWMKDPYEKANTESDSCSGERDEAYCGMGKHIVLLLFTFGVWMLIWIYRTTKFLNKTPKATHYNPTSKLLLFMFVPFYSIYWFYKHGQRIDAFSKEKKLNHSDMATLCLILGIFIPLVACILMQDKINALCTAQPSADSEQSADDIKKYKELLDSGIISQEEFDAKKKQLLDL